MAEATLGDVTFPHFIAKQLNPSRYGISEADLASAIQEIEIQTQILGASFIKVHVDDPEWRLTVSGLLKVDEDGLLNELEVEFPEDSGYFWRLCAVEGSTELSMANLILTFEDRVVARLREQWGERTFPPGLTTRAQVVKTLVEEANLKEKLNPPIRFVSPGLNRVEPVAEAKTTKLKTAAQKLIASENKQAGIHAGASFKIKGVAPSPAQRAILNEALAIADELNTGQLATEALIQACITENDVSNSGEGLLNFEAASAATVGVTRGNIKQEVTAFLTKSYAAGTLAVGTGGAIEYAKKHPNAPAYEVAQAAQGSGAGEASKGAANYGAHQLEAQEIIHAYGSMRPGGTTVSVSNESDVGQLSRGTPQNPDEDSWDCITRFAQEVDWSAFTDGRNTLYYMDGPDLIRQRAVCYVDAKRNHVVKEGAGGERIEEDGALIRPLFFSYDNTAFQYRATHKVKARTQRRSKISKPQTPSEIRMNILCGITEFRAGEVIVFRNCGPISENGGRWIISDATRYCLKYPYTQLILTPPVEPLPEPKTTSGTTSTNKGGGSGSALAAFEASGRLSEMQLPYVWGGGHGTNGLEGIHAGGPGLDCSGSTCWVLRQAGMFSGTSAEVSGELENFGEAGKGKEMTVWASAEHVFIEFTIPGHGAAQMNTNGPQNGPRLYTLSQTETYNPSPEHEGFTARHFPGT